jgi:hypothetical protein
MIVMPASGPGLLTAIATLSSATTRNPRKMLQTDRVSQRRVGIGKRLTE